MNFSAGFIIILSSSKGLDGAGRRRRIEDDHISGHRSTSAGPRARRRRWLAGCGAAVVAALATLAGLAQDVERQAAGRKIVEVRVVGNQQVSEHEIRGQIQTRPGQIYDRQAIQEDQRNIFALRRFESVTPTIELTEAGVVLTFTVVERGLVEEVEFRGAREIKPTELSGLAEVSRGDPIDPGKLLLACQKMLDLYRSKGYYFADVSVDNMTLLAQRRVVFQIREGQRVRVREIRFEGHREVREAVLARQIETSVYRWILSPGILDTTVVKADVTRLAQYYRDQGYLDAKVGHRLDFADGKRKVTVVFLVEEGARYRIGTVEFQGNTVFAAHQLRGQMLLGPDQPLTADAERHDVKAIRDNLYGADGYIDAQVSIERHFADEPTKVNLAVRIVEGARVTVGRIDIVGNDITQDKVIRRHLKLLSEEPYNVLAAEESRRRLENTGLFAKVEITPTAGVGDQRDVLVLVEEGKTASFMVGVGFSTNDGLLGRVMVEERNFDLFGWPKTFGQLFSGRAFRGAGQTLRLVAEPGTELNRFQIQFREPFLMDQPVSLGTNLYFFTRPREAYDESRVGYTIALGQRLGADWSLEEALRLEGVDVAGVDQDAPKDIRSSAGQAGLISAKLTLARDTTDRFLVPTTGERLAVSVEPAGGESVFVRLGADYRVYRTVRTDVFGRKSTLSGRAAVGYIVGDAPVYERFYAGGIGSMRGFKFRGVGPRDGPDDDPIGGHFDVLLSGEYAFPLVGKSSGVFFIDTGTVERAATISSWRASAGFEVRIPIDLFGAIPLTLGVGVPLAKDAKDETQLFYILFGANF